MKFWSLSYRAHSDDMQKVSLSYHEIIARTLHAIFI